MKYFILGLVFILTASSGHASLPYSQNAEYNVNSINSRQIKKSAKLTISDNPFRYSRYYTDPESGIDYLMSRYYSPDLMAFISRDTSPVANRYSYCEADPISMTDRDGHTPGDEQPHLAPEPDDASSQAVATTAESVLQDSNVTAGQAVVHQTHRHTHRHTHRTDELLGPYSELYNGGFLDLPSGIRENCVSFTFKAASTWINDGNVMLRIRSWIQDERIHKRTLAVLSEKFPALAENIFDKEFIPSPDKPQFKDKFPKGELVDVPTIVLLQSHKDSNKFHATLLNKFGNDTILDHDHNCLIVPHRDNLHEYGHWKVLGSVRI